MPQKQPPSGYEYYPGRLPGFVKTRRKVRRKEQHVKRGAVRADPLFRKLHQNVSTPTYLSRHGGGVLMRRVHKIGAKGTGRPIRRRPTTSVQHGRGKRVAPLYRQWDTWRSNRERRRGLR